MALETIPFNIDQFKARLGDGGARPNQFRIDIHFPSVAQPAGIQSDISSYLVNIAELPGQTIGVTPVYYRGREIKLAGDKVFAPFTCTIINDSDFTLRNALERWMNLMESNTAKTGEMAPLLYQQTIDVVQLNRKGVAIRQYNLRDAFPTDISPIGLDFAANDQLSTFSVTFQYQSFTVQSLTSSIV
jgi:hypothetical protein